MVMIWAILGIAAIFSWGQDKCWIGPDEVLCKNCMLGRKCEKGMSSATKLFIGLTLFLCALDFTMMAFHVGLYSLA